MGFWERVRSHKIIQWAIGYVGAALALAQGLDVVAHAFGHTPDARCTDDLRSTRRRALASLQIARAPCE